MSAEQAQREPTMEEILASIRRIISEEDRPPESGGDVLDLQPPAPPPVEAKAPPKPEPRPEPVYTRPAPITFDEPEPTPSRALDDDLMIVERFFADIIHTLNECLLERAWGPLKQATA